GVRSGVRRRPDTGGDRQRAVRVLRAELRLAGGRGHSQPGGRRAGGLIRRLSPRLPAVGADLSDREHSRGAALDLQPRAGALLRARRARRVSAGRRLARCLVCGARDRRDRARVLHARVARHAPHAGEAMRLALRRLFGGRFWALALKELRQIRRDRRLAISLIVPPTLQILLFGFALDSNVRGLRLGVVDESRTAESRELISGLTQNPTFRLTGTY